MREEQYLDGNGKARMQQYDQNEEDLRRLRISRRNYRVKVPEQEHGGDSKAHPDKGIVES
jgi:hypothetical protein